MRFLHDSCEQLQHYLQGIHTQLPHLGPGAGALLLDDLPTDLGQAADAVPRADRPNVPGKEELKTENGFKTDSILSVTDRAGSLLKTV